MFSGFDGRHDYKKADMRNAYERLDRAYEYLLPSDRFFCWSSIFLHRTAMCEIARGDASFVQRRLSVRLRSW